MLINWILSLCVSALVVDITTPQNTNAVLCSQVRIMTQVCVSEESSGCQNCDERVGKSGPPGPMGPPGINAEVDYNRIDDKINQTIKALIQRINTLEELVTWYKATNGYLYKVFTQKANYAQAIQECAKYGASLAVAGIIDPDVKSQIKNLVIGGGDSTYVGADDRGQEGSFVWLNGKPVRDEDVEWSNGQPDNSRSNEDCVVLARPYNWKYNDVPCTSRYSYICEKTH